MKLISHELSRRFLVGGVLVTALLAAGCTVRPLLATDPVTGTSVTAPGLSSIAIAPVGTRYGQSVRNHLIFLLNGGAGQPANARYALELSVTRSTTTAARIQVQDKVTEPTAETLTMTATYKLTDSDGTLLSASGKRSVTSAYDVPRQEFAVLRARRDAEDRAARELAEILRLAIAQDLARAGGQP